MTTEQPEIKEEKQMKIDQGDEEKNLGVQRVETKPTPKLKAALLVSEKRLLRQFADLPLASNRDALLALQVKALDLLERWPNASAEVRAIALEIAQSFPDLNYSNAPINPDGELVHRIAAIISKHLGLANGVTSDESGE